MASQFEGSWKVWQLRRGMDRRFQSGHPWVYSNELTESPKGIEPGGLVELRDAAGKFLARGYGNPKSLIAFRSLTRDFEEKNPTSIEFLKRLLEKAKKIREAVGLSEFSYRWCFGESDGIPGLIIDRYVTSDQYQVIVIQAHTAGADRMLPQVVEAIKKCHESDSNSISWDKTAVVLRNDLSVRTLEGITEDDPSVFKQVSGIHLNNCKIKIKSVLQGQPLHFEVDLFKGQKTGFFLDQFGNIELTAHRLKHLKGNPIRILDLCCYVGQWGAQLTEVFRASGIKVEVTAVDASSQSLEFARRNVEAQGAKCETLKADVLRDLGQIPDRSFDIVISDPPALIKSRKDIPAGTHAYLQLATQVFRLVKPSGAVVCCSCSALLEEQSFSQLLAKATRRNGVEVRWVGRGAQSPDHPIRMEFPEGQYLKSWVGVLA